MGADRVPAFNTAAAAGATAPPGGGIVGILASLAGAEKPAGQPDAFQQAMQGAVANVKADPMGAASRAAANARAMVPNAFDLIASVLGIGGSNAPATPAVATPAVPTETKPGGFTYQWPGQTPGNAGGQRTITIPGAGAPSGDVASVIAEYLPKMIGRESGGKMVPNAAGASSAFGPAQFTDDTWKDVVKKHDPELFAQGEKAVMSARTNDAYHRKMALNFTMDNAAILQENNIPVTPGNLYAMHFFGQGAGPKVLKASPDTPISDIVNADAIAANPHLKGMTAGKAQQWAANFIEKQGAKFGMPSPPDLQATQLPAAPQFQAPIGVDLSKVMELVGQLKPTQLEPMSTSDRLAAVLGAMAAGTKGAKNIGDLFAGMGAGAGTAAATNIAAERGENVKNQNALQDHLRTLIGMQSRVAEADQSSKNLQIETANKNKELEYNRAVNQAKLDNETRNRLEEIKYDVNWKEWQQGQPQFTVTKDGITVVTKQPDGGAKIVVMPTNENASTEKTAELLKDMNAAGLKDTTQAQLLRYGQYAKDPLGLRRVLMHDAIDGGMQKDFLKSQYENIRKLVQQGVQGTDTKQRDAMEKERWLNILMTMLTNGQLKDEDWIPIMAKAGNVGARILTSNGTK